MLDVNEELTEVDKAKMDALCSVLGCITITARGALPDHASEVALGIGILAAIKNETATKRQRP